jgi:hypothetical protein
MKRFAVIHAWGMGLLVLSASAALASEGDWAGEDLLLKPGTTATVELRSNSWATESEVTPVDVCHGLTREVCRLETVQDCWEIEEQTCAGNFSSTCTKTTRRVCGPMTKNVCHTETYTGYGSAQCGMTENVRRSRKQYDSKAQVRVSLVDAPEALEELPLSVSLEESTVSLQPLNNIDRRFALFVRELPTSSIVKEGALVQIRKEIELQVVDLMSLTYTLSTPQVDKAGFTVALISPFLDRLPVTAFRFHLTLLENDVPVISKNLDAGQVLAENGKIRVDYQKLGFKKKWLKRYRAALVADLSTESLIQAVARPGFNMISDNYRLAPVPQEIIFKL